jgi:hypothetical protein
MIDVVSSVGCWLPVEVRCVTDVSEVYATKIFILSSHYNHFAMKLRLKRRQGIPILPSSSSPEHDHINTEPPWNIEMSYVHYVCYISK